MRNLACLFWDAKYNAAFYFMYHTHGNLFLGRANIKSSALRENIDSCRQPFWDQRPPMYEKLG